MKLVSRKEFFGIVCLCLASSMLTAAYVYGQISQTHIVSGGAYSGAPNYTVWTNGAGTYYAKNAYGALSFSSVDFIDLVGDCQDALTSNDGAIYITAGEYDVGSVLQITHSKLHLYGDGRSTVLKSTVNTGYMLVINSTPAVVSYVDIDNLCFYNPNIATYNLSAAIYYDVTVESIYNTRVSECVFLHLNAVWGSTHADHNRNICHATFSDLTTEQPPSECFRFFDAIDLNFDRVYVLCDYFDSDTVGVLYNPAGVSAGARFTNCRFIKTNVGVWMVNASDFALTNVVADQGAYAFILTDVVRCMLTNCYASTSVGSSVGYYLTGTSEQNRFINCEAFQCATGFQNSAAGKNNAYIGCNVAGCTMPYITQVGDILEGDISFRTESSGSNEIVSGQTSVLVTHGLSYTPIPQDISVTFTENPTNTPGACWISDITSTQFRVNVENDPGASNLSFSWHICFGRRYV